MLRLLYALALGIVSAGIVHIVILLLLPGFSERDIWSRLSAITPPYVTTRLDSSIFGGNMSALAGPFILEAACRFDLADSGLRIRSEGSVPFWSMSVFDSNGLNVFSISDRAANNRVLDFVVVNPEQMRQLRQQPASQLERSIFVEAAVQQAIAVVRVFVPDETWSGEADAFLDSLNCTKQPLAPATG
ncbi:DUF1254 domain-containing protein [Chelativorans sp. Marseille-P2723]|uniref:DUF1254 domain-containing protein n=1 Tax=Chelativorans sp. Marseille-P2723 TaxID=2709133 RepID=UPI00156DAAC3|nr:DUF1254 domain-containing protein [Chelativorans sp. Marseille-P2723]